MKMKTSEVISEKNILANDHYATKPYDCSAITAGEDGTIAAGTIVPANDATAEGVLLHNVAKSDNPNGTIVIHGFIDSAKLPAAPSETAKTALNQVTFM